MKTVILILTIICLIPNVYGQDTLARNNNISFETGFWNRGLLGISYHRHKRVNSTLLVAAGGGIGLGASLNANGWDWDLEESSYGYLDGYVGFGKSPTKIILGCALKFVSYSSGLDEYIPELDAYDHVRRYRNGFSANPFIGFNYDKPRQLSFQLRVAPLFLNEGFKNYSFRPGLGMSLGYSF